MAGEAPAEEYVHEGRTADQWREEARARYQRSAESFERSDTDGFLTQWAADTMAGKYDLQAQIAENGGRATFPALFDLDDDPVAAKLIETQYGMAWGLLSDPDDTDSEFTGFVNPSRAQDPARRAANMAKKGYQVKTVMAPATAALSNGLTPHAYARRTDGGYNPDAEVVEDEQD